MTFQRQSALVDRTSNARGTSTPRALSGSVAVHLIVLSVLAFGLREAVVGYQSPHQLELEFVRQTEQLRKALDHRQLAAAPSESSVTAPAHNLGARTRVAGESDTAQNRPVGKHTADSPYPLPVPNTKPAETETGLPKSGRGAQATSLHRSASEACGLLPAATDGGGTPYVGSPAPAPLAGSATIAHAESTAAVRQDQFIHQRPDSSPAPQTANVSPLLVSSVAGIARGGVSTNDEFFSRSEDGNPSYKIIWPRGDCSFNFRDGFNVMYTAPVQKGTHVSTLYLVNEAGQKQELWAFQDVSGWSTPNYAGTKTHMLANGEALDGSPIAPGRYKLVLLSRKLKTGNRTYNLIDNKPFTVDPQLVSNDPQDTVAVESQGWFTITDGKTTTPLETDLVNRFFAACPLHLNFKTNPQGSLPGVEFSLSQGAMLRSGGATMRSGD